MELLRTERLLLRHWDESDLPAFFYLCAQEDVVRWLGAHPRRPLASVAGAQERLGRWHEHERDLSPPFGLWAIVPCAPGARPGQLTQALPQPPLRDAQGL